jgi:fucose permease
MKLKRKRSKPKKKMRLCGEDVMTAEERAESEVAAYKSRADINKVFKQQQSFEIWMLFIFKLITSVIFLIDDLTFLLYCEYEFHMTQSEAGLLFCISALCLFTYGITIAGFIIDKMGVKYALMLGLSLYAIGKFVLIFADTRL